MPSPVNPLERVRPSLLDRLLPPDADEVLAGGRGGAQAGDGMRAGDFRDTVRRDLEWLFNASAPLALEDAALLRAHPRAARSVLNYGLRHIFGRAVTDLAEIERQVAAAIALFEPRLQVDAQKLRASQEGLLMEIEIEGTLLTRRSAGHVVVRTDLDTLSSEIKLNAHG